MVGFFFWQPLQRGTDRATKEAALLRRLMDLTAVSSQAPERGQEGQ